jgi:hypothetical protein
VGARPGGDLGGAGRICALGVAVSAALTLSSATFVFPAAAETSGAPSVARPARPLERPSLSVGLPALADDAEDDPAAEALSARFAPSSLPPAERLRVAHAEEALALPAAAPGPRGPPAGSR